MLHAEEHRGRWATPGNVERRLAFDTPASLSAFQWQDVVLVIHSADRFTPNIEPQASDLQPVGGPNGLWPAEVASGTVRGGLLNEYKRAA